ncbi:MAG: hypothetical protein QXR87_07910 [Candidatus Hadarchaeales archaeon]
MREEEILKELLRHGGVPLRPTTLVKLLNGKRVNSRWVPRRGEVIRVSWSLRRLESLGLVRRTGNLEVRPKYAPDLERIASLLLSKGGGKWSA